MIHKEKIDKLGFIKMNILCSMKNTIKQNTGIDGEKNVCESPDKLPIFRINMNT